MVSSRKSVKCAGILEDHFDVQFDPNSTRVLAFPACKLMYLIVRSATEDLRNAGMGV